MSRIAELNPMVESYQGDNSPNTDNSDGNKNILIVFLTVLAIALAVILYLVAGKGCSSTSSESSARTTQVVDSTKTPNNATDDATATSSSSHHFKKSSHDYPPPTRKMTLKRMFREAPPEARR